MTRRMGDVPDESATGEYQSAVLVRLPETASVVEPHRSRLDPAQPWGVPPHVTVLFPFVPPAALTEDIYERLAGALARVDAFEGSLTRTAWFGEEVLWLAPTPEGPFRFLTEAVCSAFPDYPPYEGAHDEVIPHLTVGESRRGALQDLRAAERELAPQLPISYRVRNVTVMTGSRAPDSWHVVRSLPLRGRSDV
jgi:2'-5' RNA ligase